MNDVCDACESDERPVWPYTYSNGDPARLCDDCLAILKADGAVEL